MRYIESRVCPVDSRTRQVDLASAHWDIRLQSPRYMFGRRRQRRSPCRVGTPGDTATNQRTRRYSPCSCPTTGPRGDARRRARPGARNSPGRRARVRQARGPRRLSAAPRLPGYGRAAYPDHSDRRRRRGLLFGTTGKTRPTHPETTAVGADTLWVRSQCSVYHCVGARWHGSTETRF